MWRWPLPEFLPIGFGSLAPRLAEAPHLIGVNSGDFLQMAMDLDNGPLGIMGLYPDFEENGDIYRSFDNSAHEDFVLWCSPQNQSVLKNFTHHGTRANFDFVAPLSRRKAVFQAYDCLEPERGDYYYCIDKIADFLDEIGFLYTPLEPDGRIAMLACSKHQPYASKIPGLLESTHLPLLRLQGQGASWQWEQVGDWSKVPDHDRK